MREPVPGKFILYQKNPLAEIHYHKDLQLALVVTTANFIPFQDFKSLFVKVGKVVEKHSLQKVLFDKRSLTIFHQPSMEWYYLEWKAQMLHYQWVMEHGKILPQDDLFRKSVEKARQKIFIENPTHPIHELKVVYYEDFQEALENQSKPGI